MSLLSIIASALPATLHCEIRSIYGKIVRRSRLKKWEENGKPLPPPHEYKQITIEKYARDFGNRVFVETGTYLGNMLDAEKDNFDSIYSIELDHALCVRASKRFSRYPHISIVEGDSGSVLSEVVKKMVSPGIFWLDGHYSAGITAKGDSECPIFLELDAIFGSPVPNHVILIDDARCFNGSGDYPDHNTLMRYVHSHKPEYSFSVENDIFRCLPPRI